MAVLGPFVGSIPDGKTEKVRHGNINAQLTDPEGRFFLQRGHVNSELLLPGHHGTVFSGPHPHDACIPFKKLHDTEKSPQSAAAGNDHIFFVDIPDHKTVTVKFACCSKNLFPGRNRTEVDIYFSLYRKI